MSDLVPTEDIERIVGIERHPTDHYGRLVSSEAVTYILHSQQCKDSTPDLRDCPYSRALDRGIMRHPLQVRRWRRLQNQPVKLEVSNLGHLLPAFDEPVGADQ